MSADRLTKYIWVIDTITTHGHITRQRLSELWEMSHLGDGRGLPHRTFFTMRREIEQVFGIDIKVNSAYEYYIETPVDSNARAFRSWMLDSYAVRNAMSDTRDIAGQIIVDEVPSAREFLAPVTQAVRHRRMVRFTYGSYSRSVPDRDIVFAPYFLRLYRQRWYMVGRREKDGQIRTYALDRVRELVHTQREYELPADISPARYFEDIVGITTSQSPVHTVKLKVTHRQAKYLRDLPLHPSQREEMFSSHSVVSLRLRITPDLVREILTMGAEAEVLEPHALCLMVVQSLTDTLRNYEGN